MHFYPLAVFLASVSSVLLAPSDDVVKALPGVGDDIASRHYSGYLNGGDGRFLHYWFMESQKDPINDPLLLWLNGGPGCSSMVGALSELGAYYLNEDGLTLRRNEFSWNTFANLLFLESPACVGFSYAENQNCAHSDNGTAEQNYNALQDFFLNKFPEYRNNEFFVTGESYAGVYVPTLSLKIAKEASSFAGNFQGFAAGNGYLGNESQSRAQYFYAHSHALIGPSLWSELIINCCGGVESPGACDFVRNITEKCDEAVYKAGLLLWYGGINPYKINSDCVPLESSKDPYVTEVSLKNKNLTVLKEMYNNYKLNVGNTAPICEEHNWPIGAWINQKTVRAALNIPEFVQDWERCSFDPVTKFYQEQYVSMNETLLELSRSGIRGLIYNGDADLSCNFLGNMWELESLHLPEIETWRRWLLADGQIAGFYKKYRNIDFVTIRGSGHFAPFEKPIPTLQMIKAFVENASYNFQSSSQSNGAVLQPELQMSCTLIVSVFVHILVFII